MATLKGRAQHKLFAALKKVRLTPLSIGDAYAVALTVMRSSSAQLLHFAEQSKKGTPLGKHDFAVFSNAISSILDHRDGSIYASFVTAVDTKHIFHGERFAVSLARLGVTDELRNKLFTDGFANLSDVVSLKAPWFWADLIVKELETVRNETSSTFTRILSRFTEEVTPQDVNDLLESVLFKEQPLMTAPAKVQIFQGADLFNVEGGLQNTYLGVFRRLAQSPRMVLLDQNSSLEGVFTTFHQHLLTDTTSLQRLLPGAKFGGKKILTSQLQRIFKDNQFVRHLRLAFMDAYTDGEHAISVDRLYRAMRKYSVHTELARAAKIKASLTLSDESTLAIVNGIVGLFFAFSSEMKGQSFPLMKMLKGQ